MGAIMSGEHFSNEDWRRLLRELGENPDRSGLLETPQRMAKAWKHWTSGYEQDPADILKVFSDGAEKYNELILVRGIPVYSHCEHHLAPFFGLATIGYTPRGSIVGLSKLTRLVDCFAKRLQVQERLTIQVADALMTHLKPLSVGVVVRCRHMCMESRGIRTPGEETVTSAMLGELQTNLALRTEFLALERG
jgi:GTP cyclohydrolase IA